MITHPLVLDKLIINLKTFTIMKSRRDEFEALLSKHYNLANQSVRGKWMMISCVPCTEHAEFKPVKEATLLSGEYAENVQFTFENGKTGYIPAATSLLADYKEGDILNIEDLFLYEFLTPYDDYSAPIYRIGTTDYTINSFPSAEQVRAIQKDINERMHSIREKAETEYADLIAEEKKHRFHFLVLY